MSEYCGCCVWIWKQTRMNKVTWWCCLWGKKASHSPGEGGIYTLDSDRDVPLIWVCFLHVWYAYGSITDVLIMPMTPYSPQVVSEWVGNVVWHYTRSRSSPNKVDWERHRASFDPGCFEFDMCMGPKPEHSLVIGWVWNFGSRGTPLSTIRTRYPPGGHTHHWWILYILFVHYTE